VSQGENSRERGRKRETLIHLLPVEDKKAQKRIRGREIAEKKDN
jgi:hypothetical protein